MQRLIACAEFDMIWSGNTSSHEYSLILYVYSNWYIRVNTLKYANIDQNKTNPRGVLVQRKCCLIIYWWGYVDICVILKERQVSCYCWIFISIICQYFHNKKVNLVLLDNCNEFHFFQLLSFYQTVNKDCPKIRKVSILFLRS